MIFITWWVATASLLSAVGAAGFVLRYGATLRWEDTTTGRAAMAAMVALTVIASTAAAWTTDVGNLTATAVVAGLAWTVMAVMLAWLHWRLPRNRPTPKGNDSSGVSTSRQPQ